jgi:hypothetical protein
MDFPFAFATRVLSVALERGHFHEKARKNQAQKGIGCIVDNNDEDCVPVARIDFDFDRVRFDSVDRG